jgi:hypothetical protein
VLESLLIRFHKIIMWKVNWMSFCMVFLKIIWIDVECCLLKTSYLWIDLGSIFWGDRRDFETSRRGRRKAKEERGSRQRPGTNDQKLDKVLRKIPSGIHQLTKKILIWTFNVVGCTISDHNKQMITFSFELNKNTFRYSSVNQENPNLDTKRKLTSEG